MPSTSSSSSQRRRRQRDQEDIPSTNNENQQQHTAYIMKGGAGNINNLTKTKVDTQPLLPDQVTIQVKAIGLNFADLFAIQGLYSATPSGDGWTPGLEVSGIIINKGSQVSDAIPVGARVFGCTRFGGFTTKLNLDARYVRRLPDSWSFAEGASFLAQSLTAYFGLVTLGGLKKDQIVLIHSCAGGTGLWATRFCQLFGAHPIGTVSSANKVEALSLDRKRGGILKQPLPKTAVINRNDCSSSDLAQVLKDAVKNSYPFIRPEKCKENNPTIDLVFDSLLGDWFKPAWNMLEPMGRHVVLGAASMTPSGNGVNWLKLAWQWLRRPMIDPLETISLNKSFLAFNLIWLYEKYEEMVKIMDEMLDVLGFENGGRFEEEETKETSSVSRSRNKNKKNTTATNEERPHVGCTFSFDQLPDAIRHFQSGNTIGKVVVLVEDEDGE